MCTVFHTISDEEVKYNIYIQQNVSRKQNKPKFIFRNVSLPLFLSQHSAITFQSSLFQLVLKSSVIRIVCTKKNHGKEACNITALNLNTSIHSALICSFLQSLAQCEAKYIEFSQTSNQGIINWICWQPKKTSKQQNGMQCRKWIIGCDKLVPLTIVLIWQNMCFPPSHPLMLAWYIWHLLFHSLWYKLFLQQCFPRNFNERKKEKTSLRFSNTHYFKTSTDRVSRVDTRDASSTKEKGGHSGGTCPPSLSPPALILSNLRLYLYLTFISYLYLYFFFS